MTVNAFNSRLDNYARSIPTQVPLKMTQGFLLTAAISLIITGSSLPVAILGGAVAATATLIEALTRPIIKDFFGKEATFIPHCIQFIVPTIAAFSLAAVAAPIIGVAYRLNGIIIPTLAWFVLNNIHWYESNIAMAQVF